MAATYDISANIGPAREQTDRGVAWKYVVDFSTINSGSGLAAGESCKIADLPAGFLLQDAHVVLRTAEGATGTVDVGDEDDPDAILDGGNANGTVNALIAKGGSEAYGAGHYFHATKELWVAIAAAQPTLDAAVVQIILRGVMMETTV